MSVKGRLLVLASLAIPMVACVYDNDPPRRLHGYDDTPSSSGTGTVGNTTPPASSSGTTATSPAPLLVEIDTDQTMSADPGEGVGVFVEYAKGGHWHVWWTCDTNKTQQSCSYGVNMSVQSGAISSIDSGDLVASGNAVTSPTASRLEVRTTTSTQVHGVYFQTDPGATLTLDATLDGLKDGSFLFFVQDGKVNGGYQGTLTNPIQLQGNTP